MMIAIVFLFVARVTLHAVCNLGNGGTLAYKRCIYTITDASQIAKCKF